MIGLFDPPPKIMLSRQKDQTLLSVREVFQQHPRFNSGDQNTLFSDFFVKRTTVAMYMIFDLDFRFSEFSSISQGLLIPFCEIFLEIKFLSSSCYRHLRVRVFTDPFVNS